jgi:serine phosphatase RsbU (regulator of sigma subunit)/integral membrane sensor domain MASE1/anti-sigma regulatory factor (Ser/Thr protein kinase)
MTAGTSDTSGRPRLRSYLLPPPPGSPGGPARHAPAAYLRLLVLVAVAYYLGARLGLNLSLVDRNVTPLWPPTGVAVAAFLIFGRSLWPAVAVAAFAINLPISTNVLAALVTAGGNTAAPLVAVLLLQRVGFRRQLDTLRDALAIVFLGALASMLVSASVGAATLAVSGGISTSELPSAFAVWWTGDAMGVLVVAPFLLSIPLFWEERRWTASTWFEAGAILVVTTATSLWAATSHLTILFLVLPAVGWASWRLQLRGAAPTALVASLVATWAAAHKHGPFAGRTLLEEMFTLQAFNACVALTSFLFAALVSQRMRAAADLAVAAAELEQRVTERTAELSALNERLLREIKERSEAQHQLSQEEARAQREHQIAETLQRSLLPERIPRMPGVALAARYVPASADVQVGGDWYDIVQLREGLIGLAIGDVAGHGLAAAATMGQLRMALRAYALQDPAPASVMSGVHQLASQLPMPEMATLLYLVYDPTTRQLRYTNAGHPPALVFDANRSTFLRRGLGPPIGVTADPTYVEATYDLPPGATVLLYTDGLVERRGKSIWAGLARLRSEVEPTNAPHDVDAQGSIDLDALCDRLLATLLDQHNVADDVALVAMRPESTLGGPLHISLPAEARMLAHMRIALRRWLRELDVAGPDMNDILVACSEACSNVVQHAYGPQPGDMDVSASLSEGSLELVVRDTGRWRPAAGRGGGWGLQLIRALMDSVEVEQAPEGTEVRMRRRIKIGEVT